MSGILTIGVVLQDWFEKESLHEAFKKLIENPIIREVSIFRNAQKEPINSDQVKQFSRTIRGCRPDINIAVDHEGGLVQRLRGEGFSSLPKPDDLRQLYQSGQETYAQEIAKACGIVTAYELGQVGINILYGPVFDTYNPDAAVIGKIGRSYGNPPVSTALLKSYLDGLNGCLYSIAKHFPDHGQVTNDTHIEVAIDTRNKEDICTQSLPPYKKLTYDGLMIAHVIYAAVDSLPATLSEKTIGFFVDKLADSSKPIFSDALEMNALTPIAPTINERVKRCLESGCDAILYCGGGGKQEPDYFDKLQGLLDFFKKEMQTNPAFLQHYQAAEKKLDQLSKRKLNPPPSKEEYDDAKKTINTFNKASAEVTTSTPTMRR
jgi:beta-N-acetylhexosaminidase